MELKGRLLHRARDFKTGSFLLTFAVDEIPPGVDKLPEGDLTISLKKYREKRSLNANALLWTCIGEMASALRADKWEVYLHLLKQYGKYTYICVKPEAVESVKKQWRESEELGHININGKDAVQMLCYFGSSTYDTAEFSALLDGTLSEMKEVGIQLPPDRRVQEALAAWKDGAK